MSSNGESGESTSTQSPPNHSSRKAERPPVLKKFKTVAPDDPRPTPHFPGPLFPAVRRVISLPTSSDRRGSVDIDTSADKHSSKGNAAASSFNNVDAANILSGRDWMYPSFLGPHAARNRVVTVKPASKPPVRGDEERLVERVQGKVVEEKQQSNTPAYKEEIKIVASQASTTTTITERSSVSSSSARRIRGLKLKRYFIFSLVENSNLRRWCSETDVGGNSGNEALPPDADSSYIFFGNADSKTVALYTVILTLTMPFVLYKCLDYLPQIKIISKRTKPNKEEVPLEKRIAYMVDVCFSVYPYAKLLALLLATIFLIAFGGLALYAVTDGSLTEALWLSWTFVADSGNHADSVGIGPRIVSVSISSGGMLIFAMMLELVSDAISEKVDSLRKGKSEVIEKDHMLILGWSDKLGSLLKQLAIANKSVGGGVVVVLEERDKEEMEMDIAKLEFDFMGTSVICRCGSPLILADLKKVSVSKARVIIVLASDENADQSDARALRVVLSLTGVKEGLRGHVVVEMSDLDNEPLVKLVGGDLIETVVAHDVIGRLMIQCALQPGLTQFTLSLSCTFKLHEVPKVSFAEVPELPKYPERILFCGWRRDIHDMIMVLEAFLAPGSELWMFNEVTEKERETKLIDGGLDISGLENIKLVHREGNAVIRRHLESRPLETFDSSKRLPYKDMRSTSLRPAGFSHISWICEMQQASDKSIIISEILDSRTRNLVSVSRISDYVLSNELGNEMCIKPAEFYLFDQEELCFYEIMIRDRQRKEIVIGYRLASSERAVINPPRKSE
ncbi:putative ion channel POLLUX [Hibiscus syriacus]|uniref:Ion channel POLLUX n=1 Tax=Hibiscus syriacus TaxID=106335 RepID=A0A6A2XTL5_HIBSY|nr:putative ion channel POLLUX [Hibiscus syriacus]